MAYESYDSYGSSNNRLRVLRLVRVVKQWFTSRTVCEIVNCGAVSTGKRNTKLYLGKHVDKGKLKLLAL